MPIIPPPRKVTETEYMLRLLYAVDALGSLTAAQLWSFAAEQELMDYVTMRLCLHKLLSAGELETGEGALMDQLLLTDRGREAIQLFGGRLPADVRERILTAAPEYRQRVQRNRQVQAVYEMARPGDYRLNLSVREGDLPTIRLHVATRSRALASKAIHRFAQHAAEATTYLYTLAQQVLRGDLPDASCAVPSGSVTEHSATEYTASVSLAGKLASFEVMLLLPTRQAAEDFVCALRSPEAAEKAANHLADIIGGVRAGKGTQGE